MNADFEEFKKYWERQQPLIDAYLSLCDDSPCMSFNEWQKQMNADFLKECKEFKEYVKEKQRKHLESLFLYNPFPNMSLDDYKRYAEFKRKNKQL